ncbi:hypothetical protein P4O66_000718 [Electrophorus voltai]|uniref:C2 domain-containing protein n=1 Tax=Electrophorus voltai TaxID=2609070 RepID=A0AAD9DYS5_9TELE|nr:hypothetical protein P4O66_000718 [Electrophorus voltai]
MALYQCVTVKSNLGIVGDTTSTEQLVVKILKALDLPAKDANGFSDPYVKIYLLPDRKKKFQTKVHRKTLNPIFNETFQFGVPLAELHSRKLHFSIYDFDRFSRHDLIGQVVVDNLLDFSESSADKPVWRDIVEGTAIACVVEAGRNELRISRSVCVLCVCVLVGQKGTLDLITLSLQNQRSPPVPMPYPTGEGLKRWLFSAPVPLLIKVDESCCLVTGTRNEREREKADLGELNFSLCYLPTAGRLTVTIIKATNLKAMDLTGFSDPYVKASLVCEGRRLKKRKTSIKKNTLNPTYNEALVFDIPNENMENMALVIAVMDYDCIGHNEVIGMCRLGSDVEGPGREHWAAMLANPRKPIEHWHQLVEVSWSNSVSL